MATADVVVVGAGIIGSSIAWRLAQSGAAVTLLDAGRMGGEASWAGAGMLAPGGEVSQRSGWAERAVESLHVYPEFVTELREETGLPIDYRACGAFELAASDVEWSKLMSRGRVQAAVGIRSQPAEAADLAALGLQRYQAALFYPDDALVDPREVMAALRAALEARGVKLREHTRAQRIDPADGTVVTPKETFTADRIVLAAGAWSSQLLGGVTESFPVKGHLLGYHLGRGSLKPIVRHQHTYVLQRSSGFTVAGSTTEHVGFDREVKPAVVGKLQERVGRCLPSLLQEKPATAWIGFRPGAASDDPQVGLLSGTRAWLAYGHYRNGILLAPATAREVARGITSSSGTD